MQTSSDLMEQLKIHTCKRCGKVFQNIDKSGCLHQMEVFKNIEERIGGERTKYFVSYHCLNCKQKFDHVYIKLSRHWGSGISTVKPDDFKHQTCDATQHVE